MFKKAQAAMEFLMTYGWAILVVLVAIGALAYFGVLNPSRFLPESCTLAPGLSCDIFVVRADGTADLVLRNGLGTNIDTITMWIDDDNDGIWDVAPLEVSDGASACGGAASVSDGSQLTCQWTLVALPGAAAGSTGDRYKRSIRLQYRQAGSTIDISKIGDVVTRLQ